MALDLSLRIGGEAGQGIETVGTLLAQVLHRDGLYVFTHQDYMSRIRGGHNYFQIRVSDEPVGALSDQVDLLVALDRLTAEVDRPALAAGGLLVVEQDGDSDPRAVHVPFGELAEQAGSALYRNVVAVGAALGLAGHPLYTLHALLEETFSSKGAAVVEGNRRAAEAGRDHALLHCRDAVCPYLPVLPAHDHLLIAGTEAMALAALAAGVRFYAAYPMTPSTGILTYLAQHADEFGVVVEQAEDEIAAINLALGASYAGARAMTATSGGGFALMVEGLSLAGITETPLVVGLGQRPGPATGLPTRTEQGDLWFALHGGHGEFPRVVLAPGDPTEAFDLTFRAFNLADKYQVPVIVMFDQYLGDMLMTTPRFDLSGLRIERHLATPEQVGSDYSYRRYALTESGVSPRALPGTPEAVVYLDSDEHDEEGHLLEDGATRVAMVDKRLRKHEALRAEALPPQVEGEPDPEVLLIGWGSTRGCLAEAADLLRERGVSVARAHCPQVWPLPTEALAAAMQRAREVWVVENNATGQFTGLLRRETGLAARHLGRYDGRPFSPAQVAEAILPRKGE